MSKEKEQIEKDKVFEVRKIRLAEIGIGVWVKTITGTNKDFVQDSDNFRCDRFPNLITFSFDEIKNADVIEFENLLNEAKTSIQKAKENQEKEQSEKQDREKAEIEAKKKADKENKSRVKRLSKDKAIYKKTLQDTLGSFPLFFDSDQTEVKDFSIEASNRVTELLKELLTELENL